MLRLKMSLIVRKNVGFNAQHLFLERMIEFDTLDCEIKTLIESNSFTPIFCKDLCFEDER